MVNLHQRTDALLEELLALQASSEVIPLAHHSAGTSRRHDGVGIDGGVDSMESASSMYDNAAARALDGVPFEEHLGLRFYLEDPLPMLRQAFANNSAGDNDVMFVDHEFPTHDGASVTIEVDSKHPQVKCVPGIISSTNCSDFRKDPNRIRRIGHFVNKAKVIGGEWTWIRASSMKNRALFSASSKSVDPRNVIQGKVGNCGFCAGFASIAFEGQEVLMDAFGDHSASCLSSIGAASVKLFVEGNPRYLLIDDYLLCSRGTRESPSMHSLLTNDLWVRLLEKAFVKIQGTYASLDGHYKYNSLYRHPARAMQLLTGASLALEVHYKRAAIDKVYDLLSRTQGGYARVAHCRKRINGLHSNHGYSLLWVGEGAGGMRIICLRNPHGCGSHKGDKGMDERIKAELLAGQTAVTEKHNNFAECQQTQRLIWRKYDSVNDHSAFELNAQKSDNGIFFLPFKFFVDCFPIVTLVGPVCHGGVASDTTMKTHCVHKVKLTER